MGGVENALWAVVPSSEKLATAWEGVWVQSQLHIGALQQAGVHSKYTMPHSAHQPISKSSER